MLCQWYSSLDGISTSPSSGLSSSSASAIACIMAASSSSSIVCNEHAGMGLVPPKRVLRLMCFHFVLVRRRVSSPCNTSSLSSNFSASSASLGAVAQWLQCKVYFDTSFAMSLKMLAILQVSFVVKIPKETEISASRYRGHFVGDKRDV